MTVVNLNEYKKKKQEKETGESSLKQEMKRSLDNDTVMRRYNIVRREDNVPDALEQRVANIRQSVQRINALMDELKQNNTGGKKS